MIGAALSSTALIVFLLLIIFEKKVNRVAAKILFPLTVPVVAAEELEALDANCENAQAQETDSSEQEQEESGDN